jgi:RHS repeat-associated protein
MKKVYNSSNSVIDTTYYINQNYMQIINTSGTFNVTYYYLQGQLIAQDVNGVKNYYHTDNKGNIVATSNSSASIIEINNYSPTGEITSGGNKSKYTYEGKEYDKTTGMTDYNFRMYQSSTMQFTQPDSIIQNTFDPQSLNRYAFERNNPIKNTDPTGHNPLVALGVAGLVGGLVGLDTYLLTHDRSEYTWKGAGLYAAGGAASAMISVASVMFIGSNLAVYVGSGALGGVASQVSSNYGDNNAPDDNLLSAIIAGGIAGSISKNLPVSKDWLIKYTSSYFTTKTGSQFIINNVISESSSNIFNSGLKSILNTNSKGHRSYAINGLSYSITNSDSRLFETIMDSSKKGETAGDALRRLRNIVK